MSQKALCAKDSRLSQSIIQQQFFQVKGKTERMFTFKASPIYCSSKEDKLIITTDGLAVVQLFSLFFHSLYVEEDLKEHSYT